MRLPLAKISIMSLQKAAATPSSTNGWTNYRMSDMKVTRKPALFTVVLFALSASLTIISTDCRADGICTAFTQVNAPSFYYRQDGLTWGVVVRESPDQRYVAQILAGDAEAGELYIGLDNKSARRHLFAHPITTVDDVAGCIWIPGKPHDLVFSSGGCDFGVGILAIWLGPHRRMVLQHAITDAGEGFNVRSVSSNGTIIDYEHFGEYSPDPNYTRDHHLKVRLKWDSWGRCVVVK